MKKLLIGLIITSSLSYASSISGCIVNISKKGMEQYVNLKQVNVITNSKSSDEYSLHLNNSKIIPVPKKDLKFKSIYSKFISCNR